MSAPGPPPPPKNNDPGYMAQSNTAQIMTVITLFHVLALVSIALRLYARIFLIRAPGADDYVMILCGLCTIGGFSVFWIQAQYGLGKHQDTISASDFKTFQHAGFWQSIISAGLAIMFLKISIALNLIRLSKNRWYTYALWATIIFTLGYCLGGTIPFFLRCVPMAGFWDKSLNPWCYDLQTFINVSLLNTSCNIFTDVVLATLPVPIVWALQMKLRARLYVIGILSLGYFAVAMGIVKAVYQIAFGSDRDKTFTQSIQFWGFLQLNLGIIAACAPALKPLVGRLLKLNSSQKYGYDGQSHRSNPGLQTIGGTGGPPRSGRFSKNEFEMDDRSVHDSDPERDAGSDLSNSKGENVSVATSFYKHSTANGSSSEEMILSPGQNKHGRIPSRDFKGIMRTTEVIVKG